MELDKFSRQLRLLELLIGNNRYSPKEIGEKLGLSLRSVYRYIEFYKNEGFDVYNFNGIYTISHTSPFVASITQKMHFTDDELKLLSDILIKMDRNNPTVNRIKQKFKSVYGMNLSDEDFFYDSRISENIETIQKAIKHRHQCVLHQYESLHNKEEKDRLVEPYQLLNLSREVRCYEIESGICKTFKISRIKGTVTYSNTKWEHRDKHTNYFTDLFGFSASKVSRVVMRMTKLAKQFLIEEYGLDETKIIKENDNYFLVSLPICNVMGIGRFVMGFLNDVEILKGKALKDYIDKEIGKYSGVSLRSN